MSPDARVAMCPGTYDPVTLGHLDIIARAARIFSQVVVAVTDGSFKKQPMFSTDERIAFVRQAAREMELDNVRVESLGQLVTDHARMIGAHAVVKGLRAISDFDYEFQMAQINKHLAPELETVYLPASPRFSFISSSGVREVAAWGGDVEAWVPAHVARALRERSPRLASADPAVTTGGMTE